MLPVSSKLVEPTTLLLNSTSRMVSFALKIKKNITGKVSKTITYGCEHSVFTQKSKSIFPKKNCPRLYEMW